MNIKTFDLLYYVLITKFYLCLRFFFFFFYTFCHMTENTEKK